jgi:lysyl-tRNA synthetase class 2
MSQSSPVKDEKNQNISYSSAETQKKLRLQKLEELKKNGIDPFTSESKRDFSLGFIRFWFDFVHKFDFTKVFDGEEEDLLNLDYFLQQVLFPRTLLERMEDKIQLRYTVREMGLDPDQENHDFDEEYESEIVEEARNFLYNLRNITDDQKTEYLRQYLKYGEDENTEEDTPDELKITLDPNQIVILAGRLKSKRVSGKIAFGTIEDESLPEGFQFIFKKDELTEDVKTGNLSFDDYKKLIDEGDYIQATGKLDYSQRGEPSLFVTEFRILTKALRSLPENISYQDIEYRYINRVADFKLNTVDGQGRSVRDLIRLKNKYWQVWREEMQKEGFLEVECPIFEEIPGGADARPFTTFYNALDQEMYLRIALELPLKKLIAGGFEKVFEIGRIFRNEGVSPQHLQEYTQIEWYWAYTDYNQAMDFISKVYRKIAQEIIGGLIQTDYYGNQINWGAWCSQEVAKRNGWKLVNGWPAIKYFDVIRFYSKGEVDLENKNEKELLTIAKEHGVEIEKGSGYGNILDKIYKKVARPFIQNPIFLYHQPVELEPLAKRDPKEPKFVHRWQIVAGTAELGKAFSELNDPIDQFERFEEQQSARDAGDEEAQFMNKGYVEALEYGLPPLSGFGMSERLLSFMLGKNIKETVTFPHVRSQNKEMVESKSKKTMVAHSVILDTKDVPLWSKMNAVAHLAASLGAREGKKLIWHDHSLTKDGAKIPMNIQHAIMMKKTDTSQSLLELKKKAEAEGLEITCFTKEMRDSNNDEIVKKKQEEKKVEEIEWLGILIFGEKKKVENLTAAFNLFN